MTLENKMNCTFVIDAARLGEEPTFSYLCGNCGERLIEYATRELLDCMFVCPTCRSINESPVETPFID